ncbi:MAG: hypothetical protein ACYTGL_15795 [Planctomycetota bacterium]
MERIESFEQLAESRRQWISEVLMPWCRRACLRDLREAEHDWLNIAGRVDPAMTLYTWAWSRFPALIHEGMTGLNETQEVCVALHRGETVTGYPDARESRRGELVLTAASDVGFDQFGPYSIDQIASVELTADADATAANLPARVPTTLLPGTPDDERV